jgi:hypothetical protein
VEKARSHQSVDWYAYFKSIRSECPWSYAAYLKGQIHITEYTGQRLPLGAYSARMYVVSAPNETVEALASGLNHDDPDCEWLFSYPGYGDYATPVSVLIQQSRSTLKNLRSQLGTE